MGVNDGSADRSQISQAPLEAAQRGDVEAFGEVIEAHQGAIRAFLAVRLNDPFEAYDLAQEVFVIAWKKLAHIDVSKPLRPWLRGIAANLVRKHVRKNRAIPVGGNETILELLDQRIDTHEGRSWQDAPVLDALEGCLAKMGESARSLLQLRYEEGLSIGEIREQVGGNHSAMTMKLHRLRSALQICIEGRLKEAAE
jgi:RNA polymerase sigma-70 factor, ECF subfamily